MCAIEARWWVVPSGLKRRNGLGRLPTDLWPGLGWTAPLGLSGHSLVPLDPDLRKAFRGERAVNGALRLVIELRKVGS
jgi:hypothetical protein